MTLAEYPREEGIHNRRGRILGIAHPPVDLHVAPQALAGEATHLGRRTGPAQRLRQRLALAGAILEFKSRGTTFVVITHRTSILGVADKLLILRDGTVQAFGPREDVLAHLQKANEEAAAQAKARAEQAAQRQREAADLEVLPAPEEAA